MKILVYKDAMLGKRGADFAVCETLRLFLNAGYEVVLFLGQAESAPRCAAIPTETKVRFFPKPKKTLFSKLGLTHPFRRYAHNLVAEVERERPDVVIVPGSNELLDLVSFGMRPAAPIVRQVHVDPCYMLKSRRKARNRKIKEAFRSVAMTQVLCDAFVPIIEDLIPATRGKVTVIGNACPWLQSQLTTNNYQLTTNNNPYILYPAAFTREKNQRLLIDAFASIAADFPEWQVHLYGTGASSVVESCKARVKELHLEERILFKGFAQDLKPAYADCAFVATPSVSEGFPLMALEAAAFKKPLVGLSSVPAFASLIKDNVTGHLATRETFADALRDLMANPEKCHAFGVAACEAAQAFSPSVIQAAWCALVQHVLQENPNFRILARNLDELCVLGEGSRRRCFEFPGGAFCVKFYHLTGEYPKRLLEKRPQVIREIEKYRHSRTKNTSCQEYDYWLRLKEALPPDLFAAFPEHAKLLYHANRGWGIVETRFKNFDGSDLRSIADELKTMTNKARAQALVEAFATLCEGLAKCAVKFYDPPNVLVQWHADGSFKLRIADFEPANRVLIPLFTNAKFYIRLRVRRRAQRYAKILQMFAGNSLIREVETLGIVKNLVNVARSTSASAAQFFVGTLVSSDDPCFIKITSDQVEKVYATFPQELTKALGDAKYARSVHVHQVIKLSDGSQAIFFNQVRGVTLQEMMDQKVELSEKSRHVISAALFEFAEAFSKCSFVHRDVCAKNLIFDEESETLTLIDFDTAVQEDVVLVNNPSVKEIRNELLLNYGYYPAPGVWNDIYSLARVHEIVLGEVNQDLLARATRARVAKVQFKGDDAWRKRIRFKYLKLSARPLWLHKKNSRFKKAAVLKTLRQIHQRKSVS